MPYIGLPRSEGGYPSSRHVGSARANEDGRVLQGRRQCIHSAYVTPGTHGQTYPARALPSRAELIFRLGVWRNIALAARHSTGRLNRPRAMESEAGPSSPRASTYAAPPPPNHSPEHARSPSSAPGSHSRTRRSNTRSRSNASSGTGSTGTTTTQSNRTDAGPSRRRRRRRRQEPSHESSRDGKSSQRARVPLVSGSPGSPRSSAPALEDDEDWLWDEQPKLRLDVDLDVDVRVKGKVGGKIVMAILPPKYIPGSQSGSQR
ncbi:hypothetical protein HDZ31DRAFT_82916 [Schizophyllum fasciatum]